ncbi:orange carotenoid protein N-terminal domain-containing protein [Leptolyngbya sp. CCNP1308]|uniref:orange carotenoid protein N-terminal domain-containing protein n=1 Tax=Leptolyngbya sp. CCNP1308 TaxID=3110255 RepID=UPI002B2028EB|nr:orange carotenoid protein N-terminal domain-containing protein [Leptolyngbya sp. CCNP1308]MEA5447500.1 orange carotenoid protein N-terminal domain-containing protein [Leptolyngbya sp. CCNP1308]
MTAIDVRLQFEQAVQSFESVDVDCKIAVLWQIYDTLGQAFAAIAPVALFSQAVQQLLSQIQQVDRDDQSAIMRDILAGADTRFTQAYQALNTNMKLAFWHRLFSLIPTSRLPITACRDGSATTQALIARIGTMGLNERLHFLRRAVG